MEDEDAQARFLAVLAEPGTVTDAAKAAGWSHTMAFRVRDAHPAFAEAWKAAWEAGTDALELEAMRRAGLGYEEPVWYQGNQVGTVRKFSDRLMELMLKARRPERYRERYEVTHTVAPMSAAELQRAREAGMAPEVEAAARTLAALPVPRPEAVEGGGGG